ncbi:hypothetical protein FS749_015939 [Ceratobasidium sp. UAMH 11750]|nr:hypothetical protein FS749_015939 [Ceratobasidium sp. UAMH 11750]
MVDYEIVDDATVQLIKRSAQLLNNPAQRREAKIQQYQAEKQLKSQIQALRSQSLSADVDEPANNYDALRALLPPSSKPHAGAEDCTLTVGSKLQNLRLMAAGRPTKGAALHL